MNNQIIKSAAIFFVLVFFGSKVLCQSGHSVSFSYTPALSQVNTSNFTEFSINSFTKELYLRQKPDMPKQGSAIGVVYSYRFNKNWSLGIGYSSTKKESSSGRFYLRNTSTNQTLYYNRYESWEIPIRATYCFNTNFFTPIISLDIGIEGLKKFEMPVFGVNQKTGQKSNFLTETHFGIKSSLVKIVNGISVGGRLNIFKFLSLSIAPEFRYYSTTFRITRCPTCSSFIDGDMWLLGLKTELSVNF
jgi:hypothetical protein